METNRILELPQLAKALVNCAEAGIYVVCKGKFIYVSQLFEQISGYTAEELIGTYSLNLVHPDDREAVRERAIARLKGISQTPYEYRFVNKDGSITWILENISSMECNGKKATVGSFFNITHRKKIEEELKLSAELLHNISDYIIVIDLSGNIIYVNNAVSDAFNISKEKILSMNIKQMYVHREEDVLNTYMGKVIQEGEVVFETPPVHIGNRTMVFEIHCRLVDVCGKNLIIAIGHDISARKNIQEQLEYLATHDVLTGLPNRALLNDRLNTALMQAKRYNKKIAIMILDLDRFKNINDTFGHQFGDELLINVSNRLSKLLRESDSIARIGGDEFVILLPEINSSDSAIKVAEKILDSFKLPFSINNNDITITTSIGIAIYPESGENSTVLFKYADDALYLAKQKGRSTYELSSSLTLI